jgi:hypothetical protein
MFTLAMLPGSRGRALFAGLLCEFCGGAARATGRRERCDLARDLGGQFGGQLAASHHYRLAGPCTGIVYQPWGQIGLDNVPDYRFVVP